MKDRITIRFPFEDDEEKHDSLMLRLINFVFRIASFPFFLFFIAIDKISGQEKWYKAKVAQMDRRTPLTGTQACSAYQIPETETEKWCAIRSAVAEAIGVHAESIYPTDSLSELMRMQFPLPDVIDLNFRIEKKLNLNLSVNAAKLMEALPEDSTFQDFAQSILKLLGESPN